MTGAETPETRWATHKRQVISLWNCCILLDELFESFNWHSDLNIKQNVITNNSKMYSKRSFASGFCLWNTATFTGKATWKPHICGNFQVLESLRNELTGDRQYWPWRRTVLLYVSARLCQGSCNEHIFNNPHAWTNTHNLHKVTSFNICEDSYIFHE
jgi:hypothetical protein